MSEINIGIEYKNKILTHAESGEYVILHTAGQTLEDDLIISFVSEDELLAPGLYDIETNELIASWNTLVNYYGMDVEKDYFYEYIDGSYKIKDSSAPMNILPDLCIIYDRGYVKEVYYCKLIVDSSVTKIGDCAFCGCNQLLQQVVFPNSITSIGSLVFKSTQITSPINLPIKLTSIGELAFDNIPVKPIIPDSVTSIGQLAFNGISGEISLGNNINYLGTDAFGDGYNIVYNSYKNGKYLGNKINPYVALFKGDGFEIHPNTRIIANRAFEGRTDLTSITIPASVVNIGELAFGICESLTTINYEGTKAQWNAIAKHEYWKAACPVSQVICSDGTITL